MNLLDGLFTRRSIRKYTGGLIGNDDILKMIRAGMYAPSANNRRPWHFIVVDDREVIGKIIDVHPYAAMLKEASHAIVICGNKNLQTDAMYYPLDCSAATQNILLAAHELGYGAVWLGVYPREARMSAISKVMDLPEHLIPVAIVSVGIPEKLPEKHPDRFEPEKISYNHL